MPRMSFNLREPKICVVRIHATNFFSSWSAKNLQEDIDSVSTRTCMLHLIQHRK